MLPIAEKPLIWRYRLKSRGLVNAMSNRREFEGTLIQIDGGFGCIHPWPERGDPPLEKCLADLAGARRWPLVRRAIRCAEFDRAARVFDRSLFEDLIVPQSHATLTSQDPADVAAAAAAGFTAIKLKAFRDHDRNARFLAAMAVEHPTLRWRIDFNEQADADQIAGFLSALSPQARAAIDFIEDPCPFSRSVWESLWKELRVPLAVDREASPQSTAAQVMILKPAVDEPLPLVEAALAHNQRLVVTNYMDHPLGQAFAAWEAARIGYLYPGLAGLCGLQTRHLFEPDEFSEWLGPWSPEFTVPGGTGLGFDDLLDALPWTRLY